MEQTYIVKVSTEGIVTREPFNAADSLKQLQTAVGGYIELVPIRLKGQRDLFVDEEGKLKRLPLNMVLTDFFAATEGNKGGLGYFYLNGPGVFAAHDDEGNNLGLPAEECAEIEADLANFGGIVRK